MISTKEQYTEPKVPRRIKSVEFGVLSPDDIVLNGEIHVYDDGFVKKEDRKPIPHGVLDPRLGVSSKTALCQTCGQGLAECAGHFGYIRLELPVFHYGYFKHVQKILQSICKSCSRVLLFGDERQKLLNAFKRPNANMSQRGAIFKKVWDQAKIQGQAVKSCPYCNELNGSVKKVTGALKLFHDKYKGDGLTHYMEEFEEAAKGNEELAKFLPKVTEDLHPLRVLELLKAIPAEDCKLLDLPARPETLLMTHIAVPPVCIRPSVEMESGAGSNEDDISVHLHNIIMTNNILRSDGLKPEMLMDNWDLLQRHAAHYVDGNVNFRLSPGELRPRRPLRGFAQRLKGKQGRFRGNLSGKRVDFSGRTVISPDPNLRVDEVGLPEALAKILTYPEVVTPHNIQRLRKCVLNGTNVWPGANYLRFKGGISMVLKFGDRRSQAADLKVGDVVERHLRNGDIVLFNRQPSLHRLSIMAHRVRVHPWRTFRFNECVCSPYNADFDGDEMNIHVPQTEESRAEAIQLMGVMHNLATPKNGEILVAATQDFLMSAYLLTNKDKFFDRSQMGQLAAMLSDGNDHITLPTPAIIKPQEFWTGKQLFSLLLRPNESSNVFVNLETKERAFTRNTGYMCPNDGFVCFYNSELLTGRLGKGTLGGGNKAGLFQVLSSDFSPMAAAACMNRLAKLSSRFIGERGMSIGIDDVTPAQHLLDEKVLIIRKSFGECQTLIAKAGAGTLDLISGKDMDGSLEARLQAVLNEIRETASKLCLDILPKDNSPLNMERSGSKGSKINIAQMAALLGQQIVSGKRAPNGFTERSLPHFPRGDKSPEAKGFVANSFYSGLTPTEFFFHTMGGREGLVDTAVKTAETGYMARRLMKALEDLYMHYDGTVRNAVGWVVQLTYGDDGLDPMCMEGEDGQVLQYSRAMETVRALNPRWAQAQPKVLSGIQLRKLVWEQLGVDPMTLAKAPELDRSPDSDQPYRNGVRRFLLEEAGKLEAREVDLQAQGLVLDDATRLRRPGAITETELKVFLELCRERFRTKVMEPGSMVGAFGAHSIAEPGTQMTLKTFHFAGVASMNVTLGVPRLKELVNASKNISTPVVTVRLLDSSSEASAQFVKAQLEKTFLKDISTKFKLVLDESRAFVQIKLSPERISALRLSLSTEGVANSILGHKFKWSSSRGQGTLLPRDCIRVDGVKIQVFPPPDPLSASRGFKGSSLGARLHALMETLPSVIVAGNSEVKSTIIVATGGADPAYPGRAPKPLKYIVEVEGRAFLAALGSVGVDSSQTTSNHVMEVREVLGVEAARRTIIREIHKTMDAYGIGIDARHLMLLADTMTNMGDVLGIQRFGMAKMKDSILMLASFEKTTDLLFDAAMKGVVDDISGVSESVIVGVPMNVGTGLFKVMHQTKDAKLVPRTLPVLCY